MSEKEKDSELQEPKVSRLLSLSKGASAKHAGKQSRTVTVEVRRKRVSLLEKKRAIESGFKSDSTQKSDKVDLAYSGKLSEAEVSTRLRAIQNAQKGANDESSSESEELAEYTDSLDTADVEIEPEISVENSNIENIIINNSDEIGASKDSFEVSKKTVETNVQNENRNERESEKKRSTGNAEYIKKSSVDQKQQLYKTSVILRAASYGRKEEKKVPPAVKNEEKKVKPEGGEELKKAPIRDDTSKLHSEKPHTWRVKSKKSIDDSDSLD
jgi:hypothetical protein